MNALYRHIVLTVLVILLTGCGRSQLMPTSGGRSYEVLVTGPDREATAIVAEALSAIKMEGLPQVESTFDVSTLVKDELDQGTRYARNIILVSVDSTRLKQTRVGYEQNVYARPQVIIHIDAPSVGQLKADVGRCIASVNDQLTRAEINNGIVNLRAHHDSAATAIVKAQFGCRLWLPQDMKMSRQERDFLWFSNRASRGMQSICIYRFQADSLRPECLLAKRDSVMRRHVKGDTDSIYMTTVRQSVSFWVRSSKEVGRMGMRGLWEMHCDAMGGPFVTVAMQRGDSILCVEGFVYAPEMKKRNLVRRLEAAIYTLKMND